MSNPEHTKPVLNQGFDACVASLTEFGYSGITTDMIQKAHESWLAGNEPDGVIEHFAFKDFDEYPAIFGKPFA